MTNSTDHIPQGTKKLLLILFLLACTTLFDADNQSRPSLPANPGFVLLLNDNPLRAVISANTHLPFHNTQKLTLTNKKGLIFDSFKDLQQIFEKQTGDSLRKDTYLTFEPDTPKKTQRIKFPQLYYSNYPEIV